MKIPPATNQGYSIPVIAEMPECCEGLELIPPREENVLGSMGICTAKCGNGVCDTETESNYNCSDDCEPVFDAIGCEEECSKRDNDYSGDCLYDILGIDAERVGGCLDPDNVPGCSGQSCGCYCIAPTPV